MRQTLVFYLVLLSIITFGFYLHVLHFISQFKHGSVYCLYVYISGAFLIPYFIMLFSGALPVMLLEIGLGQYMSRGGLKSWIICPLFQGSSSLQRYSNDITISRKIRWRGFIANNNYIDLYGRWISRKKLLLKIDNPLLFSIVHISKFFQFAF